MSSTAKRASAQSSLVTPLLQASTDRLTHL